MTTRNVRALLLDAFEDERSAEATYAAVIQKFGPVRPFINIIEAEGRHAAALERQLQRLGFEVPMNRRVEGVAAPPTLEAACEEAIAAELESIALYERLIPQIGDATVRHVLENLQAASRDNHLPAFRRCLARAGAEGCGSGRRGG